MQIKALRSAEFRKAFFQQLNQRCVLGHIDIGGHAGRILLEPDALHDIPPLIASAVVRPDALFGAILSNGAADGKRLRVGLRRIVDQDGAVLNGRNRLTAGRRGSFDPPAWPRWCCSLVCWQAWRRPWALPASAAGLSPTGADFSPASGLALACLSAPGLPTAFGFGFVSDLASLAASCLASCFALQASCRQPASSLRGATFAFRRPRRQRRSRRARSWSDRCKPGSAPRARAPPRSIPMASTIGGCHPGGEECNARSRRRAMADVARNGVFILVAGRLVALAAAHFVAQVRRRGVDRHQIFNRCRARGATRTACCCQSRVQAIAPLSPRAPGRMKRRAPPRSAVCHCGWPRPPDCSRTRR